MSEQEIPKELAPADSSPVWQAKTVYLMAMACLVLGVAFGYLLRGSQTPTQKPLPQVSAQAQLPPDLHADLNGSNQPPTLEEMKHMADKVAAPALQKIKTDPKDFNALNDAGKVYRATHQFKLAASYYEKALQIQPKNAAVRTDLASCLYYEGDVDGALTQLNKALTYHPEFFGALMNAGIIKMQAKNDVAGAVSSWEKILDTDANPEQKKIAQDLISRAKNKAPSKSEKPAAN
jgi:cytochrome c-type biogenesis protein CcmH/NrfG